VKKTTMRRKLVLGHEIVKSLTTELGADRLRYIRGGVPNDTGDTGDTGDCGPQCSNPNSGCTTTNLHH
jgi:hypothetical protein